ncbi:MAG TPA: T9SS type A sorting domain-containing protein, partial [Rhodothermales bacterium]|nr:T9SS type A sorting domain-containing protein [Rhodothermales bacterium]
ANGSTLTASAGASVVMDQGTHVVAGTVGGSPAGSVVFNGSAELQDGGGALNFGGTGFEWQNSYVTSGTVRNTGLVRLTTGTGSRGALGATAVFRNTGTVQWEDGIFYLYNGGRLENAGLIDYRSTDDALSVVGTGPFVFVNEAAGTLAKTAGGGTLTVGGGVAFTNRGTISAENGTIVLNSTTTHTGLVRGTATVQYSGGAFTNDGAFGPGLSPGTLTVNSPYTNNALEIELAGLAAGTEHDRLVVTGAATIADTLRVSFLDDYKPSVGDAFTILTASSVTGTFSAIEVPPGFAFGITYNPTSVVLTTTAVGTASTLTGAQGWRMLAASVQAQTVDGLLGPFWTQGFPGSDYNGTTPPALPNVYRYDETVVGGLTAGYVAQGNQSDALPLGTGRMVYVYADDNVNTPPVDGGFPKLVVQSGTEATGAFTFGVTYTSSGTAANDGWNLLGNPYAATMNWDAAGWTRTNVSSAIYVWDPATAQYRTWNGTTGSLGSGLVAPAQAFWVQTTAAAPALAAPAVARTTGGTFLGRTAGLGPDDALVGFTLADAAGGPLAAWAHVLFTPEGADGLDARDAYELAPLEGSALALFTADADGRALDVQTRTPAGAAVEIPMGVAAWRDGAPVGGTYTLTWPDLTNVPGEVRLLDVVTGTVVDLRHTDHYTFALTSEESAARAARVGETAAPALIDGRRARFVLTVNAGVTGTAPPVSAGPAETALFAPAPNPTATSAELRYDVAEAGPVRVAVYDLLGREVARLADAETAAGTYRVRVEAAGMAAGVYVVRMTGPHGFVATQRMTVAR